MIAVMAEPFVARFGAVRARTGPLVWGVDPARRLLDEWGLGDSADGLDRFADIVLQTAPGAVGIIKPQAAFYERHGWRGIRTLTRLVADAREAGLLVILDAKRGDVGSTNDAYAEAYLGKDAPISVDAITVHPYLGVDALQPLIERAHDSGSCLLVVTRSSNAEGRPMQTATGVDGTSVEAELLTRIGETNAHLAPGGVGPVGAVVGCSHDRAPLDLVAANALYLAPGVGAQGATPADVARCFASCPERVMPSASRSLLAAGPESHRLRDGLLRLGAEFVDLLVS